jgi:hypothetical protein
MKEARPAPEDDGLSGPGTKELANGHIHWGNLPATSVRRANFAQECPDASIIEIHGFLKETALLDHQGDATKG